MVTEGECGNIGSDYYIFISCFHMGLFITPMIIHETHTEFQQMSGYAPHIFAVNVRNMNLG